MSDEHLFGPRTLAVRWFLEATQRLTVEQWKEVIAAWRAAVTDAWHEADAAVAAAVAASERRQAREELLSELQDIITRVRWNGADWTGSSRAATESTAHYLASLAGVALLVRDRIAHREFDARYLPFRGVIPLATSNGVH